MTQESRQVVIELLFLSLYLDDHLSLAEDEVLNSALDSLGWDSPVSREKFIFSAFSKAREVATCPIKTEAFLAAGLSPRYASQSGPMLVIENGADDACTPSHAARLMAAATGCKLEHRTIAGANHYYFGQPGHVQQAAETVRDWIAAQGNPAP